MALTNEDTLNAATAATTLIAVFNDRTPWCSDSAV